MGTTVVGENSMGQLDDGDYDSSDEEGKREHLAFLSMLKKDWEEEWEREWEVWNRLLWNDYFDSDNAYTELFGNDQDWSLMEWF